MQLIKTEELVIHVLWIIEEKTVKDILKGFQEKS